MERGRGVIDNAALASSEMTELRNTVTPHGLPFKIRKIGHVVLNVTDLERSTKFYTEVMGMKVSDVYTPDVAPGGMVFMRYNADHHGIALVGSMPDKSKGIELNHIAFEVSTLDEVLRARDGVVDNLGQPRMNRGVVRSGGQ